MRRWLLAVMLLGAPIVRAADIEVQYLRWRWTEEGPGGQRLLSEDGPLLGLRVQERWDGDAVDIAARLDGFAGEVDYDGTTQVGDPVQTSTEYYGAQAEVDAEHPSNRTCGPELVPFAGLGARAWLRRIDHTSRFSEGYDEAWFSAYARIGVRIETRLTPSAQGFLSASMLAPIYNRVRYGLSFGEGRDDVAVSPGREIGVDLEAGVAWPRSRVSLVYRTLEFSRSDAELVPPFEVFQPASSGSLLGLQVGVSL